MAEETTKQETTAETEQKAEEKQEKQEAPESKEGGEKEEQKKDEDSNIIFIGTKPFKNYIKSISIQFKKRDNVIIKARGKFITRAVDLAEVIKKKYSQPKKIEIEEIKTGSEEFKNKEGKDVSVSTIEITLTKA